jgi:hypothetical protein
MGGEGVKKCPNWREVIYGRTLMKYKSIDRFLPTLHDPFKFFFNSIQSLLRI